MILHVLYEPTTVRGVDAGVCANTGLPLWQTLGPERMCGSAQMGFRWSFTAPRQANGGTAARSHPLTKRKFRHEVLIDETSFRQQLARGCDPLESLLIRGTKNQSYMNTLSTNGPWGSNVIIQHPSGEHGDGPWPTL